MNYIKRQIEPLFHRTLARGKSILLLGARQTGKTTLIQNLPAARYINLLQPQLRQRYEQAPHLLLQEIEGLAEKTNTPVLIIIDEIQKLPILLDIAQDCIDRKIAQFVLTGSSARKLRMGAKINLLPGRIVILHLDPLNLSELADQPISLTDLLLYGSLPGIISTNEISDKNLDLNSYVYGYLEEEIRAEALTRNIGTFGQFLRLAAIESGNIINLSKISQELGISHTTIANYYQLLNDCLIVEKIEPLTKTQTRRRLTKSAKYLYFDLGVRRLCAHEGEMLPQEYLGRLFEQLIGLELIRLTRFMLSPVEVNFWRDHDGPEVDFVLTYNEKYIPIEVKWTDKPSAPDIKHLQLFQKEYPQADQAYVICQTPYPLKLADNVYAINWRNLPEIFENKLLSCKRRGEASD